MRTIKVIGRTVVQVFDSEWRIIRPYSEIEVGILESGNQVRRTVDGVDYYKTLAEVTAENVSETSGAQTADKWDFFFLPTASQQFKEDFNKLDETILTSGGLRAAGHSGTVQAGFDVRAIVITALFSHIKAGLKRRGIEIVAGRFAGDAIEFVGTNGVVAYSLTKKRVAQFYRKTVNKKATGELTDEVFDQYGDDLARQLGVKAPSKLLNDATTKLAEANLTKSGKAVLGPYNPEKVRYINKAIDKGASYFDLGKAWDCLTDAERWAANQHFLDKIAAAKVQVFLSIPKGDIRPDSYLAKEVKYLTEVLGYKWVNQWSLVPGR